MRFFPNCTEDKGIMKLRFWKVFPACSINKQAHFGVDTVCGKVIICVGLIRAGLLLCYLLSKNHNREGRVARPTIRGG